MIQGIFATKRYMAAEQIKSDIDNRYDRLGSLKKIYESLGENGISNVEELRLLITQTEDISVQTGLLHLAMSYPDIESINKDMETCNQLFFKWNKLCTQISDNP